MKNLKVTVNGIEYSVQVEDMDGSLDSISQVSAPAAPEEQKSQPKAEQPKAQVKKSASAGSTKVDSPMPGTILNVNVKEGDAIKKGQVLLILEAMKMENEIISPCDGIIESVNVNKGQNVESGSSLVVIK